MTRVYLAYNGATSYTLRKLMYEPNCFRINVLVSYVYLRDWRNLCSGIPVKRIVERTMLDSGAYSAWKSNKSIDLHELTAETTNAQWDECVSLDVIGDPVASLKNALLMKSYGSPAFPVFHFDEPWEILDEYCKNFDKVGLSCRFGEPMKASLSWLEECFVRAYPFRFHSFGWIAQEPLLRFPFHSADTASWCSRPCAFGNWKAFGGKMSVPGTKDLRAEVKVYYDLQELLRFRWRQELARWN